jgi:hypothetical protein
MNAPKFWMVVPAMVVAGVVGMAYAKLPPPSDEAKAAAVAKKAKAAEAGKKAAEALARAQDRAVANHKGRGAPAAMAGPANMK